MAIAVPQRQPWYAPRRLGRNIFDLRRFPIIAMTLLLVVVIIPAIFAEVIAPHDPLQGDLGDRLVPPAWQGEETKFFNVVENPTSPAVELTLADAQRFVRIGDATVVGGGEEVVIGGQVTILSGRGGSTDHLLGTDKVGRDILSRIIYGSRVSIIVSAIAIGIGAVVGTFAGIASGYSGGWVDAIIQRLVDISMSMPIILLGLVFVATIGPGFDTVILTLVLLMWARFARMVRGDTLAIRTQDFIARSRVAGSSHLRIMLHHIFPNIFNSLIVFSTLWVGFVILLEATLSFLGAGIPRPTPAWGLMVADGRELIVTAWWVAFFPGLAIVLTVMGVNLLGDWLRDKLDPKLRQV